MSGPTMIDADHHGELTWMTATREPTGPLRGLIRRLTGYDESTLGPLQRAELPGPGVTIIIETGPSLRLRPHPGAAPSTHRGGFVAGPCDHPTLTEHDGWQQGIQLDLTPLAARRLLGVPVAELAQRIVSLDDLLPPSQRSLPERLAESKDWAARLDRVEHWLGESLARAPASDPRIEWAVRTIDADGGTTDIRELRRALGLSGKHLISLFREHVGVPPKLHARLVRFERLTAKIRREPPQPWAHTALSLGYCDQAHLARDVRALTGMTPTELRGLLLGT